MTSLTTPRVIRQDPALGTQAVFQPVQRGQRKKLDITATWGGATIRWRGPDVLSVSDQSVLFAVLDAVQGMLALHGDEMTVDKNDPLWKLLRHSKALHRCETLSLETSFSDLARRAGWNDGGSSIARVRDALCRMAETTVWVNVDDRLGSSRLLGWEVGDLKRVRLVLNWRLAAALHGSQYARISMAERGQLTTEVAVVLHGVLSCRVDPGKAWSCGLEKLQHHIWGDALEGAAFRGRKSKMLDALEAIGRLRGWGVRVEGGVAHIGRQRRMQGELPEAAKRNPSEPVASEMPRRIGNETPSSAMRRVPSEASIGAGFPVMDASVLFSTRKD